MAQHHSCKSCGSSFTKIGQHWTQSDCPSPTLSNEKKEILIGLLMGDGSADLRSKNVAYQVNMINRAYLESVKRDMGNLFTPVRKIRNAGHSRKPVYQLRSRHLSCLNWIREWYSSGEKVFPNNIELSPKILRHWYVSDGSLSTNSLRVSIGVHNERNRLQKVLQYFTDVGLPEPKTAEGKSVYLYWNKDDCVDFFNYIGRNPTEGFLWKWPKYRGVEI